MAYTRRIKPNCSMFSKSHAAGEDGKQVELVDRMDEVLPENSLYASALTGENIYGLKEAIGALAKDQENQKRIFRR